MREAALLLAWTAACLRGASDGDAAQVRRRCGAGAAQVRRRPFELRSRSSSTDRPCVAVQCPRSRAELVTGRAGHGPSWSRVSMDG